MKDTVTSTPNGTFLHTVDLGTSEAMMAWLATPRCDECSESSAVLIRIQYPDEVARHYCLRCRPLTFIISEKPYA